MQRVIGSELGTYFITRWNMLAGESLVFPSLGNFRIDWGDGCVDIVTAATPVHVYNKAGEYRVKVSNTITGFCFPKANNSRLNLIDIEQWGSACWVDLASAFSGASNMNSCASDAPNLSALTDMRCMFIGCDSFDASIGHWDVKHIKKMDNVFSGGVSLNEYIEKHDALECKDRVKNVLSNLITVNNNDTLDNLNDVNIDPAVMPRNIHNTENIDPAVMPRNTQKGRYVDSL